MWKKFVEWFKSLLRKTNKDDAMLDKLLSSSLKYFMDKVGDEAPKASKDLIAKLRESMEEAVHSSSTKVDDLFLPFINSLFDKLLVKVIDKYVDSQSWENTLAGLKEFILEKYKEWQKG